MDTKLYDWLGPGVCVAACDFNHGNPGIRGGGLLANDLPSGPLCVPGIPCGDFIHWSARPRTVAS